jgi:indolepyruvate ferredoxin oxidoreductase
MPPGGLHIRWPDPPLEQEARLMDYKWYAALAYVRANRLNHDVISGPNDRFGIIASGKAFNDARQALADLGLDEDACRALGIRLHKVNVVWPLEASITRGFAQGLQEILVVEEKRQVIEYQLKEQLYNWRPDVRPNVVGKFADDASNGEWSLPNPSENWLLRAKADLSPALVAKAIAKRLKKLGVPADVAARMDARLAIVEAKEAGAAGGDGDGRRPHAVGSARAARTTPARACPRARARWPASAATTWRCGWTAARPPSRRWAAKACRGSGQAPFTTDRHVFANLGDGTYFHSGLLAIRQSIAAGVNITYKILYNDAVAMTGGQPVGERPEGHSVLQIMQSVLAEGARKLVIVTDEPAKYDGAPLSPGVTVHHRDELDRLSARCGRSRARRRSSTTRPAPPRSGAAASAARWSTRPARGDQRARLRGLRRLLGEEQLPVGGAGGDGVRTQAAHQPEHLQQGLLLRERLLPELRHGGRRHAEEAKKGEKARRPPSCRRSPEPALPAEHDGLGHRRRPASAARA